MKHLLIATVVVLLASLSYGADTPGQQNQGQQNQGQQNPGQQGQQNQGQQNQGQQGQQGQMQQIQSSSELPSLPEGRWYSERYAAIRHITTYTETWFEQDAVEGKKLMAGKKYFIKLAPGSAPQSYPSQKQGGSHAEGPWRCYAYDFVEGHEKGDPSDESCIQNHYKGKDDCKEDAIEKALRSCRRRSSNKATCDIDIAKNCLPEAQRLKPEWAVKLESEAN